MRILAVIATLIVCASAHAGPYRDQPEVQSFVREMVERHGFVKKELEFLFSRAQRRRSILRAIAPPRTTHPRSWRDYRARFVSRARIDEGVEFWDRNGRDLARAAASTGVPEEIIVAIIGVETVYGRNTGDYRVIDALATLAFDYPPRAEFFRSELAQYLLFARETGIDVFEVKGSYAGAIGIPQFMPSSYRKYAIDFDGNGVIDLRASTADAIGSVANYLRKHGWRAGEPIHLPAQVSGKAHQALIAAGIVPKTQLSELRRFGVETRTGLPPGTRVALIDLETPDEPTEFRLGLRNFYVLTRYNRSSFYASAVEDLASALRAARKRQTGRTAAPKQTGRIALPAQPGVAPGR